MKKRLLTFTAILALVLSISSCCLLLTAGAAGVGFGAWYLVNDFGQLIYFGDFWAQTGSQDMGARINAEMKDLTDISIEDIISMNFSKLPKPNADGTYTIKGDVSYDNPTVVGQFATYSSNGSPLSFELTIALVDMQLVFKNFVLNGTITISDHKLSPNLVAAAKSIIFENTVISTDGAVVDGIVKVGTKKLKLSDYSELIAKIRTM